MTLANKLRRKIQCGEYGAGSILPSEAKLSTSENVSKATVRQAVRTLESEGLVVSRSGSGHWVRDYVNPLVWFAHKPETNVDMELSPADQWAHDIRAQGRQPSQHIRVEFVPATVMVATMLRLDVGTLVLARRRLRLVDGTPFAIADSFYPRAIVAGTAVEEPYDVQPGVYAVFASIGRPWARTTDRTCARAPSRDESILLSIPTGVPVLEVARTSFDADGIPVRLSLIVMPGDRQVMEYDHREVNV